jgi:hypothetical protein
MEATILFVAVASLILLAVTSSHFGADSREEFASKEDRPASPGMPRAESSAPRRRQPSTARRLSFSTSGLVVPRKCVSAACGA